MTQVYIYTDRRNVYLYFAAIVTCPSVHVFLYDSNMSICLYAFFLTSLHLIYKYCMNFILLVTVEFVSL